MLLLEPLGTLPFGLPQDPTLDPLELDPIKEGGLGMFISNDLSNDCDGLEILGRLLPREAMIMP